MKPVHIKQLQPCFGTKDFGELNFCDECPYQRKCYDALMSKQKTKHLNTNYA